jgi:hypothetical protein
MIGVKIREKEKIDSNIAIRIARSESDVYAVGRVDG